MKAFIILLLIFGVSLVLSQNDTQPEPEPESEPEPEPEPVTCQVCSGDGCLQAEIPSETCQIGDHCVQYKINNTATMETSYQKGCGDCPHGNDVHCVEIAGSIHCTHCCDEDLCTRADPQMLSSSSKISVLLTVSLFTCFLYFVV